ncbi:1,6-anhydro-N-acetylmuramyl-L-alanine amidase AmpD [Variovorax sp. VNK109]|uniref:1,6-anhydro-N-acetylmuramyl-L-alanine amidase AmpD n=1 Tax=Variovorax sp. VNK109 TaxID=3400919 RepID=UPI003C01DB3F
MTTDATSALWTEGWYRFARHVPSPNHGPRPEGIEIDLIVVHSISLPPGQYGGPEVMQLFTNTLDWDAHPYFDTIRGMEVSAHFFIRRNGELWQFVSCADRAWHAGRSHFNGRDNVNDNSIGIELEGLEGGLFESAQYETLAGLCSALSQHYPVTYIAGHEHVAPGRKQDPGEGFDWPFLQRALGWPVSRFPREISSGIRNG